MRLGVEKGEAGREKERESGEVKFEREQSLGQSRRIILKGKEVFLYFGAMMRNWDKSKIA